MDGVVSDERLVWPDNAGPYSYERIEGAGVPGAVEARFRGFLDLFQAGALRLLRILACTDRLIHLADARMPPSPLDDDP